jgi:phosphoglycolate phosphatase
MSILHVPGARPRVILYDWHATLVDTLDAMYYAVDDVLPKLVELGLIERTVRPEDSKTIEDARLVRYVRENARLHPKIKADRKISRTDIFELLFGPDEEAKRIAHGVFDDAYRNHFGEVRPFEDGIRAMFAELRRYGVKLGVLSNRKREFMEHEIRAVDGGAWLEHVDTMVCGDDVPKRKPAPDQILKALENLSAPRDHSCWYVGDSTTDVIAANDAGVTAVFYNGAKWDRGWIDRIFPDTVRHPHKPDAVVNDFRELIRLVRLFLERSQAPGAPGGSASKKVSR